MSHSRGTKSPPGGVRARRETMQPALGDDLLERVLESANLRAAWQQVKANQGAPGVDDMSIEEFPAWAREHWPGIREALLEGSYRPALRQREIPKPGGRGTRRLRIPTVLDRVRAGQRVMASVARFLHRRLKLEVNVEKSQVVPTDQIAFLGFSFRGTKICWSDKTMARFKHRVKQLTRRNWGVSMRRRLTELERYHVLIS